MPDIPAGSEKAILPFTFRSKSLYFFLLLFGSFLIAVFPSMFQCYGLQDFLALLLPVIFVAFVVGGLVLVPFYYSLQFGTDRVRYRRFLHKEMSLPYSQIGEINMKPAQKIGQTLLFLELRGSRRTMIIDVTRFGKKKQAAILHLLTENTQATLNETAREIALGDYRALNRVRNENWVFIVLFLLVIVIRYLIK